LGNSLPLNNEENGVQKRARAPIPLTNPPSISARILLFEESGPVEYQYVGTSIFAGLTSIDWLAPEAISSGRLDMSNEYPQLQ